MGKYDTTKGSKTLTIGLLALQVKSAGLAPMLLDSPVAAEFDVNVEYTITPGDAGNDPDDAQLEIEIKRIKLDANTHFSGDCSEVTITRGTDIISMFSGVQITELEDRVLAAIEAGRNDD